MKCVDMTQRRSRYTTSYSVRVDYDWTIKRLTSVSRLFSANGIRTGPDGRIYIAQVSGSQISALDLRTGEIEVISPQGGDIIAPDDLDFDAHGNLYATEFMDGRVSVLDVDGRARVVRSDVPSANGITFHQGRLFIDECRLEGRVLELDLNGGAPRVLLENVPLPNALAPGPDGMLYIPVIGTDEIWRIHPEGGKPERVAGNLQHPVAVKFDSRGRIVSPQSRSGEVLRIDPRTGVRKVLAALRPGLDNLTFADNRLFVSDMTNGAIIEILDDGESREILAGGLQRPWGLAIDENDNLYIADNVAFYFLPLGGKLQCIDRIFAPGYPGAVRGVVSLGNGCLAVTTAGGNVALYWPEASRYELLAEGLNQPHGIAVASDGALVVTEYGSGRLLSIGRGEITELACGLREPIDVVVTDNGTCLVSEAGGGRVLMVSNSVTKTLLGGLESPHGLVVHRDCLYVIDAGAKELIAFDLNEGFQYLIAANLPVGPPLGVIPKPLRGSPPFIGPVGPFAGIAVDSKGTLYISADGEGSVLTLRYNRWDWYDR